MYLCIIINNKYMARHNELGRWGEDMACEKLVTEGYAIVERNWRLKHFEIDIIAKKGDRIVFAEVKTRSDLDCDPLEVIDSRKMSQMARAADTYIRIFDVKQEPQFDLFGIAGTPRNYKMEHIADAFLPDVITYN